MKSCLHKNSTLGFLLLCLVQFACAPADDGERNVEAASNPRTAKNPQPAKEPKAPAPIEASPIVESVVEPIAVPLTPFIEVQAGTYFPLYPGKDEPKEVAIPIFQVEASPVTNEQFLRFVWENPKWRRNQVKTIFADENYLLHWPSDLALSPEMRLAPVTNVSWFAARAYAKWAGRRLPNLAEWEYLASASETRAVGRKDPDYNQTILNWYSQPTPLVPRAVASRSPNFYGVYDMHGLVWEWVDDYNTALVTGESRGDSGLDRNLFCGSGSIGSMDPQDYAAFMRFAFRGSLEAAYTVRNLGFRCANR